MNRNTDKSSDRSDEASQPNKARHPIHPYFTSNSPEETIRRMRGLRERIAKFEEKLDADRKTNKG